MDYDIVDGTRPRLQLQSGGGLDEDQTTRSLSKVLAGLCTSLGIVSLGLGFSLLAGPLQFVTIWLGLSLVLGPFAPLSVTGGDCRVGVGEPVLPEVDEDDSLEHVGGGGGRKQQHSSRERYTPKLPVEVVNSSATKQNGGRSSGKVSFSQKDREGSDAALEEREWGLEDLDLLKKLMVKHPRGTLRRWEVVAEGLGGRYTVDSVVKMSKALGQKKVGGVGDQDAYSRFLSQRKVTDVAIASPLSRRDDDTSDDLQHNGEDLTTVLTAEESDEAFSVAGVVKGTWTEVEDKALLTALKTFPKDSPMRWDKVALSLPGRSKAQCFRRFSDLRKSFRSSIGGGQEDASGRNGEMTQEEKYRSI